MIFCPECENMLDISKTPSKKISLDQLASKSSPMTDDEIKNFIDGVLSEKQVKQIDADKIEQITSNQLYMKLDKNKKNIVFSKLEQMMSKKQNENVYYYVCKSCSYSEKIDQATLIMSKTGASSKNENMNINYNKFAINVHEKTLPHTRNYMCPNKNCIGNTDKEKHDAVFYRVNNTMKIMYTCCACQTVFDQ